MSIPHQPSSPLVHGGCPDGERRLNQIGAYVCRLALAAPATQPQKRAIPAVLAAEVDPATRVLAYLKSARGASPLELRLALGLSRASTYRILQRLIALQQVACDGSTRAVLYRATQIDPSRN